MKKSKKTGFTIIEVVLVLAIAGLIFLMVFLVLPTLQRNQRDAQRREDMATFIDALKKFQTNNRGALPVGEGDISSENAEELVGKNDESITKTSWKGFYTDYLKQSFVDPSGNGYGLKVYDEVGNANGSTYLSNFNNRRLVVVVPATCDGSKAVESKNPRKIAVLYRLEGSGVYCANS